MSTKFNEIPDFMFEQAGASNYGQWVIPDYCLENFVILPFVNICDPNHPDTFMEPV